MPDKPMSDSRIKWLRELAEMPGYQSWSEYVNECLDEIERLKGELADLHKAFADSIEARTK